MEVHIYNSYSSTHSIQKSWDIFTARSKVDESPIVPYCSKNENGGRRPFSIDLYMPTVTERFGQLWFSAQGYSCTGDGGM